MLRFRLRTLLIAVAVLAVACTVAKPFLPAIKDWLWPPPSYLNDLEIPFGQASWPGHGK
jgi:hypothetical protein